MSTFIWFIIIGVVFGVLFTTVCNYVSKSIVAPQDRYDTDGKQKATTISERMLALIWVVIIYCIAFSMWSTYQALSHADEQYSKLEHRIDSLEHRFDGQRDTIYVYKNLGE